MSDRVQSIVAAGQPSFVLESDEVRLLVSEAGGQMAPVTFFRSDEQPIEPYYISPWWDEDVEVAVGEPCVRIIRGDFLCFPFGGPTTSGGVEYLLHGQTSYEPWSVDRASSSGRAHELALAMNTTAPHGRVTKRLILVDGQNVVYLQHCLSGFTGSFPAGHHAMLAMPEEEGSVLVGVSDYRYGRTWPVAFGDPAGLGSYSATLPDERFDRLDRVPLVFKEPATGDYTAFPAHRGYTDAITVFNTPGVEPAWTTATFITRGFLWFTLKDAAVLPTTLMWIANRGRHFSPWNGREVCLGLEDVRTYFGAGIDASREPNPLNQDGIATAFDLDPVRDTLINNIQGVARTPVGFGRVTSADFAPGAVTFRDSEGHAVLVPVAHEFLQTGTVSAA